MLVIYSFAFIAAAVRALPSTTGQGTCRCTSDQDCWPTQAEFQSFSSQVSQPLIYPVPPATPCYPPSNPSGNCTDVLRYFNNADWRSNHSGAMQSTNWEAFTYNNGTIDACYIETSFGIPCKQGSVSVIGVDARSPEDIQAAVKFASKYNLRLAIKSTGHDFIGRSTARGSFLIWTHNMKNITYHDVFTPLGSNSSTGYNSAFTLQSGVQWHEAYAAAAAQNRLLVGGISGGGTVGAAGGWVSGGGHSFLSPTYGLGVDNVLQMTIVTADGSHIAANEYTNSDLFWALRGGGGGTWGVLTSVTYRSHPSTPVVEAYFAVNRTIPNSNTANALKDLLAVLIRDTPSLVSQGYGGYATISSTSFYFGLFNTNNTWEQANNTFKPYFDYATTIAQANGLDIYNGTDYFDSFFSLYEKGFSNADGAVGANVEISSWLLPADVVTGDPNSLGAQLANMSVSAMNYYLVAGGAVSRVDPESTGLNPAWRNALAYTVTGVAWADGATSQEITGNRTEFKKIMATLENIAPDSGAYLNEASAYEIDWKKSFFGSHYDRLKSIKDKYDPDHLFIVWEGIGSDEWDASLNCRVNYLH